jgi:DMSO/TMAO reductase YedYZ molybdopterin-dependent catalytic subunit
MALISRGFSGRRGGGDPDRLPPGQYETHDFPVLSAGPTPHRSLDQWTFDVVGEVGKDAGWTWQEFTALPSETFTVDIHCVTKWSKFDTTWKGVSVDRILEAVEPRGQFISAWCDGGYTTNLPLDEITGGKAWVVWEYDGQPLAPEHGGPARLLVPHLYFWKSAKWVRGLQVMEKDEPGFWERYGYNNHGDPWKEERYWGD